MRGSSQNRNAANRGSNLRGVQRTAGSQQTSVRNIKQHLARNNSQSNASSPTRINLDNFTTAQKNINTAIFEYLHKHGYTKSADLLQEEMGKASAGHLHNNFI